MKQRSNDDMVRQFAAFLAQQEHAAVPTTHHSIDEFVAWLTAQGLSENTLKLYRHALHSLYSKYELSLSPIDSLQLIDWSERARRELKPTTLHTYFAVLRKWATFTGQRESVEALRAPRIDATPKPLPPRDDLETLRNAMRVSKHDRSPNATTRRRDGCIFDLLFEEAMRISEVLNLRVGDLRSRDARGGIGVWRPGKPLTHLWIDRSKRNKSRMVPLTHVAARTLENWVSIHRALLKPNVKVDWVFPSTRTGGHLDESTFRSRLLVYADETGVTSVGGKTHTGRRVKITDLISRGANAHAIIKITGHKSVGELEPYVALSDDVADREWLGHSGSRKK